MSEAMRSPEVEGRIILEGDGWKHSREALERAEHLEGEVIVTNDSTNAIVRAAEGKQVLYAYSEHYASYVTFKPDGEIVVEDGPDVPEYTHEHGEDGSTIDASITDMRTTIDLVKKAAIAIPPGNLERFGGLEGVADAKMSSLAAGRYVKYYDEMSPEEKANWDSFGTSAPRRPSKE